MLCREPGPVSELHTGRVCRRVLCWESIRWTLHPCGFARSIAVAYVEFGGECAVAEGCRVNRRWWQYSTHRACDKTLTLGHCGLRPGACSVSNSGDTASL